MSAKCQRRHVRQCVRDCSRLEMRSHTRTSRKHCSHFNSNYRIYVIDFICPILDNDSLRVSSRPVTWWDACPIITVIQFENFPSPRDWRCWIFHPKNRRNVCLPIGLNVKSCDSVEWIQSALFYLLIFWLSRTECTLFTISQKRVCCRADWSFPLNTKKLRNLLRFSLLRQHDVYEWSFFNKESKTFSFYLSRRFYSDLRTFATVLLALHWERSKSKTLSITHFQHVYLLRAWQSFTLASWHLHFQTE